MTIDVMSRPELSGQRFLVLPARDRNGFETHLRGELIPQMAETSDTEYGNEIARPRAAVAKRIESGDPAHISGPRLPLKVLPGSCAMRRGHDHIFAVAAVVGDTGDLIAIWQVTKSPRRHESQ